MHVDHSAQVSVIVPVYNTEIHLPACLESLFRQTYTNYEIVVVDDCSPGDCRELIRRYQKGPNPVRYVRHETNRGLLCARLTGVKRSLSNYVAFLDSDDTARPQFLEMLITTAVETDADIVGSARFKREKDEFIIDGCTEISTALCTRLIPNHNVWTKLFRRSLFDQVPQLINFGEKEHIVSVEDVAFTLSLCSKAKRFVQIGDVLVDYNTLRSDSSWNTTDAEATLKSIQEIAIVFTYIKRLEIKHAECLLSLILQYFYHKKFLKADDGTRRLVVDYMYHHPSASDLREFTEDHSIQSLERSTL